MVSLATPKAFASTVLANAFSVVLLMMFVPRVVTTLGFELDNAFGVFSKCQATAPCRLRTGNQSRPMGRRKAAISSLLRTRRTS